MARSQTGLALLAAMPRDRVLTETDGPFAKGQAGSLQPGDVGDATAACSSVWDMPIKEAGDRIVANLRALGKLAATNL